MYMDDDDDDENNDDEYDEIAVRFMILIAKY